MSDTAQLSSLDQHAFSAMTEPFRHELQAHCYRMMGSVQDAEDMVQETFLRAWRRRETFEGRASFRAWLYKIATNICLDALDKRPRRVVPYTREGVSTLDQPIPASVNEPIWLEPYPDEWLLAEDTHPEGYVFARETITLAFVAALHLLPPRQRAVLLLEDVLDWQASEVADLLEMTVSAVRSALHRARATLAQHRQAADDVPPRVLDKVAQSQLERYMQVWETADVNGLLALLKEEATFSMPPIPSWYQGRTTIGELVSKTIFAGERANGRWKMLPARANRQLAFGLYRSDSGKSPHQAYAIQVLTVEKGEVADIITFRDSALFRYFNLPEILPAAS